MKLDIFLSKYNNVKAENRILKFFVVVIGTVVLLNTVLLYRYLNTSRTIIVPPKINSQFEIYGNKASDEYYKQFTLYITTLLLSYTPVTVRNQFGELLGLFTPSVYGKAQTALYDLADKIENAKASSVFYLSKVEIKGNEIYAYGQRTVYSSSNEVVENSFRKYVIRFSMDNGRFYLTDIPREVEEGS